MRRLGNGAVGREFLQRVHPLAVLLCVHQMHRGGLLLGNASQSFDEERSQRKSKVAEHETPKSN